MEHNDTNIAGQIRRAVCFAAIAKFGREFGFRAGNIQSFVIHQDCHGQLEWTAETGNGAVVGNIQFRYELPPGQPVQVALIEHRVRQTGGCRGSITVSGQARDPAPALVA